MYTFTRGDVNMEYTREDAEKGRLGRMLDALGEQRYTMNTNSIQGGDVVASSSRRGGVSSRGVASPRPGGSVSKSVLLPPAPVSWGEPLNMHTICMHVPENDNFAPGSVARACVDAGASGAMGSAEELDAQIVQKLSVLSIAVLAGIMEDPESQPAVKASVARYMLDRILGKPVQKQEIKTESQSVSLVIGNVLQRPELEFSPEQLSSMGVVVGE